MSMLPLVVTLPSPKLAKRPRPNRY
jgi:hypothetical protein